MEEQKNITVFQELSKLLGVTRHKQDIGNVNNPEVNAGIEKEILNSAQSVKDAEIRSLEQRQYAYIQTDYNKIVKNDQNQMITAQAYRQAAMLDYEAMEMYPTLAQALNVVSEEATTIGENGKMLTVYSDNKKIKNELENLFYNRLDIDTSLQYWCRNMCKYGDNFLFLLTRPGEGITGVRQLPAYEIHIKEEVNDNNGDVRLKYIWSEKNAEYTPWQIAHFRVLSDNKLMPYGSSILNPVRITWRQLKMSEDAMMVYRAARASERRVIKVNVGSADPADIPQMIQQAASKFKRTSLIDQNGQLNYKFNPASVEQDIFIAVRSDNATNPIETLPGASNMSDIQDISYLQNNLFCGLGIPKIFLGFSSDEGGAGDGKNLSQLDVRFSRKINKIQQCLVAEMNKMAIIHLVLRGYDEEDILNFKLKLANPSTQSEMLKIENYLQKADLYSKLTTANETGFKAMSETRAKQEIFGMSNDEIIQDLQQQLIENTVGNEIKNASLVIKNSKLFNDLYKYYNAGLVTDETMNGTPPEQNAEGVPNETGAPTIPLPNEEPETGPLQERMIKKNKKFNEDLLFLLENLNKEKNVFEE